MSYSNHRRTSVSIVQTLPGGAIMEGRTSSDYRPIRNCSAFAHRSLKPVAIEMKAMLGGKQSLYDTTVQDCKQRRQRFVDERFLECLDIPSVELLYAVDLLGLGEYCIANQITPLDIREGTVLPLTAFAVAMSLLSEQPALIHRVFSDLSINEVGVNSVWLFSECKWQEILVDEAIPVVGDQNGVEFAFCRTSQDEIWIVLLEKALAKLHGGYRMLQDAEISQILSEVTGSPSMTFDLESSPSWKQQKLSWTDLQTYCAEGSVVYAKALSSDAALTEHGFIAEMCYAVIGTGLVESAQGQKEQIVKIRVPWGEPGWAKGTWSPSDPAWNIKDNKRVAEYEPLIDGVFCLSYKDFNRAFSKVTVFFVSERVHVSNLKLPKRADTQRDSSIFDVTEEGEYQITLEQISPPTAFGGIIATDLAHFAPVKLWLVSVNGKQSSIIEVATSIGTKNTTLRCILLPGRFMLVTEVYWLRSQTEQQRVGITVRSPTARRPPPVSPIQLSSDQISEALLQVFRNLAHGYSSLFTKIKEIRPVQVFGISGSPDTKLTVSAAADDVAGLHIYTFGMSSPADSAAVLTLHLGVDSTAVETLGADPTAAGHTLTLSTHSPVAVFVGNLDPRANLGFPFQLALQLLRVTEVSPPQSQFPTQVSAAVPETYLHPRTTFDLRALLRTGQSASPRKPGAVQLRGKQSRELHAWAEDREAAKSAPCGDCTLI